MKFLNITASGSLIAALFCLAPLAQAESSQQVLADLLNKSKASERAAINGGAKNDKSASFEIESIDSSDLFREIDQQQVVLKSLRQQVEIEEERKKLRELAGGKRDVAPDARDQIDRLKQQVSFLRKKLDRVDKGNKDNQSLDKINDSKPVEWVTESLIIAGEHRSAVIRTENNQIFRAHEGDKVGEVVITEVTSDHVLVTKKGKQYKVPRQAIDYNPSKQSIKRLQTAASGNNSDYGSAPSGQGYTDSSPSLTDLERQSNMPIDQNGSPIYDSTSARQDFL